MWIYAAAAAIAGLIAWWAIKRGCAT